MRVTANEDGSFKVELDDSILRRLKYQGLTTSLQIGNWITDRLLKISRTQWEERRISRNGDFFVLRGCKYTFKGIEHFGGKYVYVKTDYRTGLPVSIHNRSNKAFLTDDIMLLATSERKRLAGDIISGEAFGNAVTAFKQQSRIAPREYLIQCGENEPILCTPEEYIEWLAKDTVLTFDLDYFGPDALQREEEWYAKVAKNIPKDYHFLAVDSITNRLICCKTHSDTIV